MRVAVTGGAGFVGAHLVHRLIERGDSVICIDNLSTGVMTNLGEVATDPHLQFVFADVSTRLDLDTISGRVDAVVHLASPASPTDYLRMPVETLRPRSYGTENALALAERNRARFVLASTSGVYGDPRRHPQREDYWGDIDPTAARSVYDEGKRYAEALTAAFARTKNVNTGIAAYLQHLRTARCAPTIGAPSRASSSKRSTATRSQSMATARQTRSYCYIDDISRGPYRDDRRPRTRADQHREVRRVHDHRTGHADL